MYSLSSITRPLVALAAGLLATSLFAQNPPSEETMKKASYAMGSSVAQQINSGQGGLVPDQFIKGFEEAVGGDVNVPEKMSYAQGMRAAQQRGVNQEQFLKGFQDAMANPEAVGATMSYAEGMSMAMRLQQEPMGFDRDEVLRAVKDRLGNKEPAYSEEELMGAMQELQAFAQQQQQAAMQQQAMQREGMAQKAEENMAKGKEFLKANAAKEGITTTMTGLQYQVLKEGDGAKPTAESTVKVHYTGRLLDGKVFDSSVERGEPVEFPLSGVIPGWTEGLQLMPVGSSFRFWIPAELAYGANAPASIGPNQVLDFEVELLEIK